MILFTQILFRQFVHKSHSMINTLNNSRLPLVTQYVSRPVAEKLQQRNLTHGERGNGLYISVAKLYTLTTYNTNMFQINEILLCLRCVMVTVLNGPLLQ